MMLEKILSQDEGKTLEFKENASSLHRVVQTVVAFANSAGGTLVIGIRDKTKEVIGVSNVLDEEERIASVIADRVCPMLFPNIQTTTWRGKALIVIEVAAQPGPYYICSRGEEQGTYVRLGSTNRLADAGSIAELRRLAENRSFDSLPCLGAKESDVDWELAEDLFASVGKSFSKQKASSLDLLVSHQSRRVPTNGAILLFGKEPQRWFPDALQRCGLFAGLNKAEILDSLDIEGPLCRSLDQILLFIRRHTAMQFEIKEIRRKEIPQYPTSAIREAVLNALIHTDYSVTGSHVQVALFRDRLEVSSPGGLPFGLQMESALLGMSRLRNRVIGRVFRELEMVEQWGSGLGRILSASESAGLREPLIEEVDRFFRVALYHERIEARKLEPWQKVLVDFLRREGQVSVSDSLSLWNVSRRTASKRLRSMVDAGLVVELSTGLNDPHKTFVLRR